MDIEVIFQISHFDGHWNFNPDWVTKNVNHLGSLMNQAHQLEEDISLSVVTGRSDLDGRIRSIAQNLGDNLIRLGEEAYLNQGFVRAVEQSNRQWILLVSGYFAFLDVSLTHRLIQSILKNEKIGLGSGALGVPFPAIMARDAILEGADHFPKAKDFDDVDFMGPHWSLRYVPAWIVPAFLQGYLVNTPSSNFSVSDFFNLRPGTLEDLLQWSHPTKWEERSYNLNSIRRYLRPIISSKEESNYWSSLKQSLTDEHDLLQVLDRYFPDFFWEYPVPLAVQWDLDFTKNLIPGHKTPDPPRNQTHEPMLNRLGSLPRSSLYPTLLQMGSYFDPVESDVFEHVLKSVSAENYLVNLHTRALRSINEKREIVLDCSDEIFCYLGASTEEQYKRLFRQSDYNTVLNNVRELVKKSNSMSLSKWKTFLSTSRFYPIPWLNYPLTVPLYFVTDRLMESREANRIFNQWKSVFDFSQERSDQFEQHGFRPWNEFYERDDAVYEVLFELPPELGANDSLKTPLYSPLDRKPCRRLQESLYVNPSGTVFPCDQLASDPAFELETIQETSLEEAWNAPKRIRMLREQEQGKFSRFDGCDYWYRPVL